MKTQPIDQEITAVKGIGKQMSKAYHELGIETVRDLLNYFPYRYENYEVRDLIQANHGEKVTVEGTIYGEAYVKKLSKKRNLISVKVIADQLVITAVWFNRMFLKEQLRPGRPVLLTGKWDKSRLQITVSESQFLDNSASPKKDRIMPVYSLPGNFKRYMFQKLMKSAIQQYYSVIEDYLPDEMIAQYKLYTLKDAIRAIHFPNSLKDGKMARRRLVYDELLFYQLQIQLFKKHQRKNWLGIKRDIDLRQVQHFIDSLPYELTQAQIRVIREILNDLSQEHAMNRLLQGDVGAGKTVVAAIALYANYLTGYQGAMMVPTEILAEQHASSLQALFTPLDLEVGLLTGKLTENQRKSILGQLQMGLIDVVVGTHALIQENVSFHQLGLVITDEQHRFGVEQRAILRKKSQDKTPDVLYMTATPIPRTLAITAFGDMDVSTIDEYPKGRKKIKTYWLKSKDFAKVLDFTEKQIEMGRQAYVICPLIEESDKLDVQNAIDLHRTISSHFPQYHIGLMHGRLPAKEKEEIMVQFSHNQIQVLVSTTVVEVGVDIPNATVMVIYDAERFGLAQLHQLRGRVGRGEEQSYCILVADPKSEIGKERMRIMTETNDGFEIARRDLELRGPGDFFGVKQSGLPDFKLADLVEDYRILEAARSDAAKWINSESFWKEAKWAKLIDEMKRRGLFREYTVDS